MVVFGQSDCIRAKWLFLGKRRFSRENWLYSGKSGCNRAKVVILG